MQPVPYDRQAEPDRDAEHVLVPRTVARYAHRFLDSHRHFSAEQLAHHEATEALADALRRDP